MEARLLGGASSRTSAVHEAYSDIGWAGGFRSGHREAGRVLARVRLDRSRQPSVAEPRDLATHAPRNTAVPALVGGAPFGTPT